MYPLAEKTLFDTASVFLSVLSFPLNPPIRMRIGNLEIGFRKKTVEPAYGLTTQEVPTDLLLEQMKGKVEQNVMRFPSELGEAHPFEYKLTEAIYLNFGFVTGVVDKTVDFVVGPGFFTQSDNEKAKEVIDQWMRDVNFDFHLRKWFREALIKGTAYLELGGGNPDEVPQGVKTLTADNMFIRRDEKGNILGTTQFFGNLGQFGKTKKKPTNFKDFRVAILTVNQLGDSPYGWGLIYPARKTVDNLLSLEKDMHALMRRKANTPIIATMGDKASGVMPTEAAIDAFGQKMTWMNAKTEWAVSDHIRMSTLDFGNIGEKFESVIKHDEDMLFFALKMPEVVMGRGSIPEGLAKVQLDVVGRQTKSHQLEIEKVIETKIFRRVLRANGFSDDVHVEFEWGAPSETEINEKVQVLLNVITNPLLSDGLRREIERRIANLMGLDADTVDEAPPEVPEEKPVDQEGIERLLRNPQLNEALRERLEGILMEEFGVTAEEHEIVSVPELFDAETVKELLKNPLLSEELREKLDAKLLKDFAEDQDGTV